MPFPTTLDTTSTIPVESASTPLSTNHVTNHTASQAAIIALETKIGIDSSAVTTTHDYKLSGVTGTDKAVSKTGTETLTNKTLTSPTITSPTLNLGSDAEGDTYYRNSSGALVRLAKGTNDYILKMNGNVPNWEQETVTLDASTTVKGIVEEATQTEVDAGTQTGTTGAELFVNPLSNRGRLYAGYAADNGTGAAYIMTLSPALTAYVTGQEFNFKVANTNTTKSPTLNVNSLGAKTIKNFDGTALYNGQIPTNGIVSCIYDGTDMILKNVYPVASTWTVTASANTRHTNAAVVNFGPSTPGTYTKMKETQYNDVPGTIRVTYTAGLASGSGTSNCKSKVYVNGIAVGAEHNDTNTFSDDITVAIGDLIQIYAYISSYTSGDLVYKIQDFLLKYDKSYVTTYITDTSIS